ncbi:DUF6713 family protein [Desulfatibacillum aliphaticivorans]|uniref:DUF6713 family protein n=1 Tax=Desulfatibacillum aliphaticivorans TaxID=218208 RepID=UPI00041F49FA|nr:DUF6713 family protein [Desulfatibacillum aliphaticivorans]
MAAEILFYCGLSLLFVHELDAIHRHEWRMFPGLSRLREEVAYPAFALAHIPLFLLLLILAGHPSDTVQFWFQAVVDGFLVVHLGLHLLLKGHDKNEFANSVSRIIMGAAALIGLIHLIIITT